MRSHAELARVAGAQFGVVTFGQLREIGFSKGAIARMTEASRMHRVHRGVYRVGHAALSPHGRCLAAVLASGDGAVLSHQAAAWLWGLLPWLPSPIDVTVPGRGHRRRDIRVHRLDGLRAEERAVREGIPVTSLERALLDLAAVATARRLQNAVERAERLGLLDVDRVDRLLRLRRRAAGVPQLLEAIEIYRDTVFSRARSERLFLALVKKAGLPKPALNTWVAGHEVDAYWEAERFAVEVDGWEAHRGRRAFEEDRVHQEDLKLAGIDVVRVTARRIERHPDLVGTRLRMHLERRRSELHG